MDRRKPRGSHTASSSGSASSLQFHRQTASCCQVALRAALTDFLVYLGQGLSLCLSHFLVLLWHNHVFSFLDLVLLLRFDLFF